MLNVPSALSNFNFRIKGAQFYPLIVAPELPFDTSLPSIGGILLSLCFLANFLDGRDAPHTKTT